MTNTTAEPIVVTLELTEAERILLRRLVDMTLRDTRVEIHRTHTPDYREEVMHHEDVLRGLLERLGG